eukprot:196601_1
MQLNLKDGDIDSILNEIEENERTHEKEEDTELMEMSSSADDEFEPQPIKSALEIAKIGTDDDSGVIEPSQHKMNQDSLIENANREDILKRKLNYLDERTQIIIIGYVRNAQKILASIIPSEVIFITLSYVDDHFMLHRGTYQWIVGNSTVPTMLSSSSGNMFSSDPFEIGKLNWLIKLYPNGWDQNGNVGQCYPLTPKADCRHSSDLIYLCINRLAIIILTTYSG